jgi:hypothetical protein
MILIFLNFIFNSDSTIYPFIIISGTGEVHFMNTSVTSLSFAGGSSDPVSLMCISGSSSIYVMDSNFTAISSSAEAGVIFSEAPSDIRRVVDVRVNASVFSGLNVSE